MANDSITAPQGFQAGAAAAGIKVPGKLDVGVVVADEACPAAAVFTTNRFCGCPVTVGKDHLRRGKLRAFVVNSGCSNVATGARGIKDAKAMCSQVAKSVNCAASQVIPSSTGLIGAFLPMDKITKGIDGAISSLSDSAEAGHAFARAIMTTDTKVKESVIRVRIGKTSVTLAGCCKGSGMIAPNMATMLCFLTTDAGISPALLKRLLHESVDSTFNCITVDECPSTSDTVAIMASGRSAAITSRPARAAFAQALTEICGNLAYQVVADGEGATRVLEVIVHNAKSDRDAKLAARAVAVSPLVKTAVHGGDPNWGRIVQALGATDAAYDPQKVRVTLGNMKLFEKGAPAAGLDRKKLSALMRQAHVTVQIDLQAGKCPARILTCDLSKEYVSINADYST